MTEPTKRPLMEETERVIRGMLRDARKARKVGLNEDGTPNMVMPDIAERARAASMALDFMRTKEKLGGDTQPTEMDAMYDEFHGTAKSDAPATKAKRANGDGEHDSDD